MSQAPTAGRRELEHGSTLDCYEIRERIGSGGFGHVYRAFDPVTRREVALKTCESQDPSIRERFAREARLVGELDHPNIVRIYDLREEGNPCFMVQEFLQGEDLARRLRRRDREPLALSEKLRLLDEVAAALVYAHSRGVVHRDVKPSNILILPDGRVKILDFGIAKSLDGPTMTRPGVTIGSLGYMAPEQIEGGPVDGRTDLFALGIVAYELFAGRRPFGEAGLPELFERILNDQPEPVSVHAPEVPPELDALLLRCLEKDPSGRPASAEEFRRELRGASAAMWKPGPGDRDSQPASCESVPGGTIPGEPGEVRSD